MIIHISEISVLILIDINHINNPHKYNPHKLLGSFIFKSIKAVLRPRTSSKSLGFLFLSASPADFGIL